MKRLILVAVFMVICGVAKAAPTAPILGINTSDGPYLGRSTFTVVDQSNTPARLNYNGGTIDGPSSLNETVFTGGATPWMRTLAQINALTANTTGQIVGCSDCVMVGPGGVCKSSGTTAAGQWTVMQATAAAPTTPLHCQ